LTLQHPYGSPSNRSYNTPMVHRQIVESYYSKH